MTDQKIAPEKITKPIQLLAAWLVGLFSINGTFLLAATRFAPSSWESGALVIAAIANVPIFLIALFLLQTKFRPELQEDSYYSSYLSSKTNQLVSVSRAEVQAAELAQKIVGAELHEQNNLELDDVLISLNYGICNHLEDKETIALKLANAGILSYTSFGGDDPPKHRCLSIAQHLSRDTINKVLVLARELGFFRYKFFDSIMEDAEEDVLFGSYGTPTFEITRKST